MLPRIDGKRHPPSRAPQGGSVTAQLETRLVRLGGHHEGQFREGGLECGDVLLRELDARLSMVATGETQRFDELGPRGRRSALLLVAERKIEERSPTRIEALALLELRAGSGVVLALHQRFAFSKQRSGERLVRPRWLRVGPGTQSRSRKREQKYEANPAK